MRFAKALLVLLIAMALAFVSGVLAGQRLFRAPVATGPITAPAPVVPPDHVVVPAAALAPLPEGLDDGEKRDIDVFRRASTSVVFITSIALRQDLLSFDVMQIPQGSGTGFVWDRAGHVVTNFHVVQQGDRLSVTLADQSEWEAKIAGVAPEKDLAVLRIEAPREKLVPLGVGRSRDLLVGQRVLAVGNPFGLDHSLTVGVVSAVGRELTAPNGRKIRDVIQTDAAINPGNSGGPLLDSTGRLVGVNTAIYSPSGASAGIGFAIPVDTVARLVPQLIEHGRALQPGIGIQVNASLDKLARRAGIEGIVVYEVIENGPAARAGLQGLRVRRDRRLSLGDVIVAVNGKRVRTQNEMLDAFEAAGVGARVKLTTIRDGREREVDVVLEAL